MWPLLSSGGPCTATSNNACFLKDHADAPSPVNIVVMAWDCIRDTVTHEPLPIAAVTNLMLNRTCCAGVLVASGRHLTLSAVHLVVWVQSNQVYFEHLLWLGMSESAGWLAGWL